MARQSELGGLSINRVGKWLDLTNSQFTEGGKAQIEEAFCRNNTLSGFWLSKSVLTDDAVQAICELLQRNHVLQRLHFNESSFTDGAVVELMRALSTDTTLTYLCITESRLTDQVIPELVSFITRNTTLTILTLWKCQFTDTGMGQILRALQQQQVLTWFRIYNSPLTDAAVPAMCNFILQNIQPRFIEYGTLSDTAMVDKWNKLLMTQSSGIRSAERIHTYPTRQLGAAGSSAMSDPSPTDGTTPGSSHLQKLDKGPFVSQPLSYKAPAPSIISQSSSYDTSGLLPFAPQRPTDAPYLATQLPTDLRGVPSLFAPPPGYNLAAPTISTQSPSYQTGATQRQSYETGGPTDTTQPSGSKTGGPSNISQPPGLIMGERFLTVPGRKSHTGKGASASNPNINIPLDPPYPSMAGSSALQQLLTSHLDSGTPVELLAPSQMSLHHEDIAWSPDTLLQLTLEAGETTSLPEYPEQSVEQELQVDDIKMESEEIYIKMEPKDEMVELPLMSDVKDEKKPIALLTASGFGASEMETKGKIEAPILKTEKAALELLNPSATSGSGSDQPTPEKTLHEQLELKSDPSPPESTSLTMRKLKLNQQESTIIKPEVQTSPDSDHSDHEIIVNAGNIEIHDLEDSQLDLDQKKAAALFFPDQGGVLQMPGPGVVLRVPAGAVPMEKVYVIHGTIHTNLKEYKPWMSSDEEYIVGPVAEFMVEGGGAFDEPVHIVIPHCVRPAKLGNIRVICGNGQEYRELEMNEPDAGYHVDSYCVHIHTRHFTRFLVTSTGREEEITEALVTIAASRKSTSTEAMTSLRVMLHCGCSMMEDFSDFRKQFYDPDMEEIVRNKIPLPDRKGTVPFPTIRIRLKVDKRCDAKIWKGKTPKKTSRRVQGEDVLRLPKHGQNRSEQLANFFLTSEEHQELKCFVKITLDYKGHIEPMVEEFWVVYPLTCTCHVHHGLSGRRIATQPKGVLTYERMEHLIRDHRLVIYQRLGLSLMLFAALEKVGVLTAGDVSKLNADKLTSHGKICILLDIIVKKGVKTFLDFCLVLDRDDILQSHIVTEVMHLSMDYIRKQQGNLRSADVAPQPASPPAPSPPSVSPTVDVRTDSANAEPPPSDSGTSKSKVRHPRPTGQSSPPPKKKSKKAKKDR